MQIDTQSTRATARPAPARLPAGGAVLLATRLGAAVVGLL